MFEEISELVQSALNGYKVCIFAYGQTGLGKTYTMMGRPESLDQKGLIPHSLEQIFETSQRLSPQGWKYHMQASVLEIYNETIRDLLASNRSSVDSMRTDSGVPVKQHAIKHDANGDTCVSDLTIVDVCSSKQPCLSGDSKTLMFVNLSPEPTSVNESLCSLRFAARVNTCQIGVPRRQTAIRSADSRLSID